MDSTGWKENMEDEEEEMLWTLQDEENQDATQIPQNDAEQLPLQENMEMDYVSTEHMLEDVTLENVEDAAQNGDETILLEEGQVTTDSKDENAALDLDEVVRLRSNSDRLVRMDEVLTVMDKAAVSIQTLMGKIKLPSDETGDSDDEMDTQVGTEVAPLRDPKKPRPPMEDKETQVRYKDILRAYRRLEQEEAGEFDEELEEGEDKVLRVRRVSSRQRDASIQVRPAGYKQLELSAPMDAIRYDIGTQVDEHQIDEDFAHRRGVILSDDDILWPTVEEFDLEKVTPKIQDYITQCWKLDPKWMCYIHPVQTFSDDLRKRFIFEAKFSVPTPQLPISPATASVYFIFEISNYAMTDDVVKVHYVVEGTRFLHHTGHPFQDKWLWSVVSDKIRLQRQIETLVFQ